MSWMTQTTTWLCTILLLLLHCCKTSLYHCLNKNKSASGKKKINPTSLRRIVCINWQHWPLLQPLQYIGCSVPQSSLSSWSMQQWLPFVAWSSSLAYIVFFALGSWHARHNGSSCSTRSLFVGDFSLFSTLRPREEPVFLGCLEMFEKETDLLKMKHRQVKLNSLIQRLFRESKFPFYCSIFSFSFQWWDEPSQF